MTGWQLEVSRSDGSQNFRGWIFKEVLVRTSTFGTKSRNLCKIDVEDLMIPTCQFCDFVLEVGLLFLATSF